MRIADYIIEYIYNKGTDTIFTVAGGGAMFLNDAVYLHKKIKYICNHHEQASAMAAEAYAKTGEKVGAVMVTSGPGSTNAITGLMEAYQNSIPVIFISSQTKRSQMVAYSGIPSLRQFGIQEVDIIPIVRSLTKYAAIIKNSGDVKYHLDRAYYEMLSGRPGPVWLDIPSDVASALLPKRLKKFDPPLTDSFKNNGILTKTLVDHLNHAKKPIIIAGGGIKLAKARKEFDNFINSTKIPVVVPDMGIDLLEYDNPNYVGHGGTKGDRAANIIIQQSDLILVLGSRLAVPFIGHEYDKWGINAKKIVVDIDSDEHKKKTIKIDLFIKADVKKFIEMLSSVIKKEVSSKGWRNYCQKIKKQYALKSVAVSIDKIDYVNMYDAVSEITTQSEPGDIFTTDAGITAYVTTQSLKIKKNQRLILPGATLTMGYNLPAVIGIWAADKKRRIICITGDGSFQMNIHELQTIFHHKIPAKIFITNNQGYLAIRTTQKNLFSGRLMGEGGLSGVSFPNNKKIAYAYGLKYFSVKAKKDLKKTVKDALDYQGPVLCDIFCPYWQDHLTISSKIDNGKMSSSSIDEMYPFLPEKEIKKYIIS